MLVEKGDTYEDLLGLAYETLGDRLTPPQKQELKARIKAAQPGSIVNMSGYMEGATKASHAENDNFLSGFHRDMDQLTDETTFLEEPGAHITSAWLTVGESIGRSFETAVDSGSPKYVRRKAQVEAGVEIATTVVPIGKLKHAKSIKNKKRNGHSGSGPASGLIELGPNSKSNKAVKNFNSPEPADFVYDPKTKRFVIGTNKRTGRKRANIRRRGHPETARAARIDEYGGEVLGGRIRSVDGKLVTDEWSGRRGSGWTDELREEFVEQMREYGVNVTHQPWN